MEAHVNAGPLEPAVLVRIGPGVLAPSLEDPPRGRPGIAGSLGVVKQVELDLPHAPRRELLGERRCEYSRACACAPPRPRSAT